VSSQYVPDNFVSQQATLWPLKCEADGNLLRDGEAIQINNAVFRKLSGGDFVVSFSLNRTIKTANLFQSTDYAECLLQNATGDLTVFGTIGSFTTAANNPSANAIIKPCGIDPEFKPKEARR